MRLGYTISGLAHAGLVVGLVFGGFFARDRLPPMEVAEVSVISVQEFEAMIASDDQPDVPADTILPPAPSPVTEAPEAPAVEDAPLIAALPEPDTPAVPEAPELPEIAETPPEPLDLPQPDVDIVEAPPIEAPPTPDDGATIVPSTPAPAPRVAQEVAPPPPPDAEEAPEVVEDSAPAEEPVEVVVEDQPPAAPKEATTEIVTEAETESDAPAASLRPRTRPSRPTRVAEAPTPPKPEAPKVEASRDAIAAAVQTAVEAPKPVQPSGPPLTSGEKDALRVAVQGCWNVGSLSTEALRTTVVVGVTMARDGKPDTGSIRMLGHEGGSDSAARQAYEAARRAIIRCGSRGYDLPAEKYAQWAEIEMTFNPERMRIK